MKIIEIFINSAFSDEKTVKNVASTERFVSVQFGRRMDAFGLYVICTRVIREKTDNKVFRTKYQFPMGSHLGRSNKFLLTSNLDI
jgi:hypothetical protein